jgi:hypothetical protein
MADSALSFVSTSSFRNTLMAKNLAPYSVPGVFSPAIGQTNYETNLSNYNVVNSPDELITNNPFAQQLYPLNQYGPTGGYDLNINYNNLAQQNNPNQGIYDINDADIDLVNEFYIDAAFVENIYGPEGGFNDLYVVDTIQNNNRIYLPYWDPPTFSPSQYTPYEILLSDDPIGTDGLLSQDSFIAKIGAQTLKSLFQDRINAEIYQNTLGLVNLESLSDPFEASLILSGQEPLVYKNWRITIPENPILAAADFITRIGGAYFPVSPIPGDYFQENELRAGSSQQISNALNVVNQLTGGFLGPILNKTRNPSEIFLANTGNGQRSALFANLNYNKYNPGYSRNYGGILGVAQGIVNLAVNLINPDNGTLESGYYVGSRNAEPSTIVSPPNQLPVDPYGRQVQTIVYGPTEMGKLYEGNENSLNFGLGGKPSSNGGGIDGNFVWISPKTKDGAGYKATVGGGIGSLDQEYNLVSGNYERNESTNVTFKEGSILDDTQRLVESADNVSGIARLKHVGNAMNQVSKVFNDGYKEITKGSKVLSYVDNTTGAEAGIEYCRIFTKDTPYYTYADLQKTDGITTSGRRFVNSIFDNTYNLNIAPLKNPGSTNILPNAKGDLHAKKYMFSIENLAWRTSSRPGYTYDDLPVCEKGPNGGRVMWFPPYNLKFSDSSSPSFGATTFLGRPEPIYTYKETSRSGSLGWTIIVDHPSVMNTIVDKQLKGVPQERLDSIIDSFFAGCVKFDIYELAKKFNTIPISQLYTYQQILNNPRLTDEELANINREIPKDETGTGGPDGSPTGIQNTNVDRAQNLACAIEDYANQFKELGFYFFNDIPDPKTQRITSSVPFQTTYAAYSASKFIQKNVDNANATFPANSSFCKKNVGYCNNARNVKEFFDNVIQSNYNKIAINSDNFITQTFNLLTDNDGTISLVLVGSASAPATKPYNVNLSKRRIDSVKQFFETYTVGNANLKKFMDEKRFIIKEDPNGEEIVVPKGELGTGFEINCTNNITGGTGTVTSNSQIYSVNAMACRRVKIQDIKVTLTAKNVKEPEPNTGTTVATTNRETIIVPKPRPTVDVIKRLKDGISKQVLRSLFSECDYFELIKEQNPMLYSTFQEKIKYFNPSFHSITPEGLNARLTFLNQCARPGETIPTIGTDGKPKYNDAVNTSFGAPPILVLRIGDFFHTKIVPESVQFAYEPITFDINPEGIGVQPMIVNVTMSFKIIGGMGLAKPIEELQNALSFNYYANTEIYDERATPTEDTSALDKQVVDAILASQIPATVNEATPQQTNDAGNTIGDIITNIPVTNGQTGEITYIRLMDSVLTETRNYMQLVTNKMESLQSVYNYGILQLLSLNRNNNKHKISETDIEIELYGKPQSWEDKIGKQFDILKNNIANLEDPITLELKKIFGDDPNVTPLREIVQNMQSYVDNLRADFNNEIAIVIQELCTFQQNYVQILNKANLVSKKTDGKFLENGTPRVYYLSGTTPVSQNTTQADDTYEELVNDYDTLFNVLMASEVGFNWIIKNANYFLAFTDKYSVDTSGCTFSVLTPNYFTNPIRHNFFLLMSRVLTDPNKKQDFINSVLKGNISNYTNPVNLTNKFNKIVDDLSAIYADELNKEQKEIQKFKNSSEYKKLTDGLTDFMYPLGKLRKFNYSTVPEQDEAQRKQLLINLYKTPVIFT